MRGLRTELFQSFAVFCYTLLNGWRVHRERVLQQLQLPHI
jgi:hypothetical protein